MAETKVNSLYKKFVAIMGRVKYIKKDMRNPDMKYTYLSEKAVKTIMRAEFVKERILFQLDADNLRFEPRPNKTDGLTHIDFKYRFIDADTGDEISGTAVGSGYDTLEKGTYKAYAGALKYIFTTIFLIPTGDDPEGGKEPDEETEAKPKTKTKKQTQTEPKPGNGNSKPESMIIKSQITQIYTLLQKKNWNESEKNWHLEHKYKVNSVKDLTFKQAAEFILHLIADDMITGKQKKRIGELYKELEWEESNMKAVLNSYDVDSRNDLTEKHAKEVIVFMEEALAEMDIPF